MAPNYRIVQAAPASEATAVIVGPEDLVVRSTSNPRYTFDRATSTLFMLTDEELVDLLETAYRHGVSAAIEVSGA